MTDNPQPRFMTAPEAEEIINRAMAASEQRMKSDRDEQLRDFFAANALVGLTTNPGDADSLDEIATAAFQMADAMIKARPTPSPERKGQDDG